MPLPPYLLNIYALSPDGEPLAKPTWSILGDTDIAYLLRGNPQGVILLGQQHTTGHYLVDPADIGLDYRTCRDYLTARDMVNSLVSELDYPMSPLEAYLIRTQIYAQRIIRATTLKTIRTAALTIGPAHVRARYISP